MFIIGVLIALGVLVSVHEFGHYIAARFFGVTVEKYSIGFGPKLVGFHRWGTNFLISLIPLGGYVKMKGDEPDAESKYGDDEFYGKIWWQRIIIVFAGPFANLILGFILFTSSFAVGRIIEDQPPIIGRVSGEMELYFSPGDRIIEVNGKQADAWGQIARNINSNGTDEFLIEREGGKLTLTASDIEPVSFYTDILPQAAAVIGSIAPGMPAYRAGLKVGDEILEVGGEKVADWYEMRSAIVIFPADEVELLIARDAVADGGEPGSGEPLLLTVTVPLETNLLDSAGQKMIGITQMMPERYFERYGIASSLRYSFYSTVSFIVINYQALFRMVTKPFLAKDHIGGPVMILSMSRQTSAMGFGAVLAFVASISLILMIMNLLPIPVLDGGHIFFFLIEGITRKRLPYKVQNIIQQAGFMLLITLMIFAFYNDISRIARRNISLRSYEMNKDR